MSLRGSVPEFPLEAVLRFLSANGKTGVLRVSGARGHGGVGLDAGRLVSAVVSEDADEGDEALGALLALPAADFEFRPGDLMGPESLAGDTEAILARASDERDRTSRIREVVPHDRLVFRLSDRAAVRTKIELSSDEWRTLLAVNGARDVAGVAAVLHLRPRAALVLLDALVRAGAVDTEEPPVGRLPPVAPEVPSAADVVAGDTVTAAPVDEPWSAPVAGSPPTSEAESWSEPASSPAAEATIVPASADAWSWSAPADAASATATPAAWSAPPEEPSGWSAPAEPSGWNAPAVPRTPELTAPTAESSVADRLAALRATFAAPPAAVALPDEIVRTAVVPPPLGAPPPAAVLAPAPPPAPSPAPVAEPAVPAAKQRGGLFGFGRKAEVAAADTTPTLSIATTRAGKLGSFANALIDEYNSGRYGKGRVEGKMTKLLLRVDEQADPIDRAIPTDRDRLSVSGLDAGIIPEAQAVPYLAFLVTQIHGDAERAFGRDKAKQGYQAARRQTLANDPVLGSADLLGRLPRF